MGFNISMHKRIDGVWYELPHEDWSATKHTAPNGHWDSVRYGWDHAIYDLLFHGAYWNLPETPSHSTFGHVVEEPLLRPTPDQIAQLSAGLVPDEDGPNLRAMLMGNMLAADENLAVSTDQ
jgi:hypothetical protein